MTQFRNIVDQPAGSRHILQGNMAFALGVVHAGYHAADGYPGTPSTEVIDRSLAAVQDRMKVGWSVNEAVAMAVAVGQSIAGFDSVVTMKIPGVFQAGDAITTSAFYSCSTGALVIYAVADYTPSSTQHVIDPRYFFSASRLPVLEPRNHQELYESPFTAADMSRRFQTPVVVLNTGSLAHSDGIITTREAREIEPREIPQDFSQWILMPPVVRKNYNKATQVRIPAIREWAESSPLVSVTEGSEDWGVIVNGVTSTVLKDALKQMGAEPWILTLGIAYPLPVQRIRDFAGKIPGKLLILEDGDHFLEEKLKFHGIDVKGKEEFSIITEWNPDQIREFLSDKISRFGFESAPNPAAVQPVPRPPALCPGCPYKAFALIMAKLKRQRKVLVGFGDIGCTTLLHFYNALDTVMCMGASDALRQGFSMMRPEAAAKAVSIVGDSTECHSGLDATRNAVFRNVPGVKIILDNRITAMTGGQVAPTSEMNLEGYAHSYDFADSVRAHGARSVVVDAYDKTRIEKEINKALALADNGEFSILILKGTCIQEVHRDQQVRTIMFDYDACRKCRLCDMCPGIETSPDRIPAFTSLCTNCGEGDPVCVQQCPFDAIVPMADTGESSAVPAAAVKEPLAEPKTASLPDELPDAVRVAVRGIGGQGNLFFGKILSRLTLLSPYCDSNIVKADTLGMAQMGGPVISVFSCGDVHAPVFGSQSADILVALETGEILRPGFLNLLKPEGEIILNQYTALPVNIKKEEYPSQEDIDNSLSGFNVHRLEAFEDAKQMGDPSGRVANVIILGYLSRLSPFDIFPHSLWHQVLRESTSGTDLLEMNLRAFDYGRDLF